MTRKVNIPKRKVDNGKKEIKKEIPKINANTFIQLERRIASNFSEYVQHGDLLRREIINKLLNPTSDINAECGYPESVSTSQYREMYDREGIAQRVVNVMPEECWENPPEIYEQEEAEETEFEKAWKELESKHHCYSYLERIDKLSGIGEFGILLLGLNDGKELKEPVDGVNLKTGEVSSPLDMDLLYLKPFDQDVVTVVKTEGDISSPRYGQPVLYDVQMKVSVSGGNSNTSSVKVHWTRVIHVADNREVSEVFGIPRQKAVYNRLHDIRKVLGGSGEMFWKGGFPGYAFETDPDVDASSLNTTELREELQDYFKGLQRYMRLSGIKAHSLTPQVSDPASHVETNFKFIGASLAIPYRILVGSERGELASSQDMRTWNKRMARRQNTYLTPFLVRPFVDRLIQYGILPEPAEYFVRWADREAPSEKEIADIAKVVTEALAKYVGGNVDMLIPPMEFLTMILKMDVEEAEAIEQSLKAYVASLPEPEPEPQPIPDNDED